MYSLKASLRRLSNPEKAETLRDRIVRYVGLKGGATIKEVAAEFVEADGDGTPTWDTVRESVRWLVKNRRLRTPDEMVTLLPLEPLPLVSLSFAIRGFFAFLGLGGTIVGVSEGDSSLFVFALAAMIVAGASLAEALG